MSSLTYDKCDAIITTIITMTCIHIVKYPYSLLRVSIFLKLDKSIEKDQSVFLIRI